jgi:DNA modification methylase
MRASIHYGDCMDAMARMVADGIQVDSIVTDPPYHLKSIVERFGKAGSAPAKHGTDGLCARQSKGFMGKVWDGGDIAQSVELWELAYSLLKPGGHLLAFSATRTQHRMVCAIEDAGFEVRDQIGWMYGTGFPKSLDVSKAIDKAAGAEREVIGKRKVSASDIGQNSGWNALDTSSGEYSYTAPATPEAQQWAGWGTALKPSYEPICVARKPLIGTVAANVLEHGTGAINIDACRVATGDKMQGSRNPSSNTGTIYGVDNGGTYEQNAAGRWPANVIHDGSDEVLAAFAAFGERGTTGATGDYARKFDPTYFHLQSKPKPGGYSDQGTAARFFYSAKASKADRAGSKHPTVKPLSLMRYLCKLVTPPGGTVLDMFAGSGTTLQAAVEEGFSAIGIERESEYLIDILGRMAAMKAEEAPAATPQLSLI